MEILLLELAADSRIVGLLSSIVSMAEVPKVGPASQIGPSKTFDLACEMALTFVRSVYFD